MDSPVSAGRRAYGDGRFGLHKSELVRFAKELRDRLPRAGEPSRDYYLSAFHRLEQDHSTSHREFKVQCLDPIFQYFYGAQDTIMSTRVARVMERLALQCGDKRSLRKSQMYHAISLADAGDLQGALLEYRSALGIAREIRDVVAEGSVLQNLGTALFYAGMYSDAMKCYECVCSLAAGIPALAANASCACSNMAQVCLRQERYESGLEYIAKAAMFTYDVSLPHYNLHRVILERVHVELALGLGRTQLADERLALCTEYARRAETVRTKFEAALARALCEIDHGDSAHGLEMLAHGLEAATLNHERVLCLAALIRAHEQMGQFEQALRCADELCATSAALYQTGIDRFVGAMGLTGASLRRDQLESSILKRTRLQALACERHATQARVELIDRLSLAAELRDGPSHLHGHRVGRLCGLFAKVLNFPDGLAKDLEVAGRLHDIGKIGLPDSVLHKCNNPDASAEPQILRAHTSIGANLLAGSSVPGLRCAEIVARHHHERWDGHGYPDGIAGKRIPVECRIVSIADRFDEMTQGCSHIDPASFDVTLAEIQAGKQKQFDPKLTDSFCEFVRQLGAAHPNLREYLEESGRHTVLVNTLGSLRGLIADAPGPRA